MHSRPAATVTVPGATVPQTINVEMDSPNGVTASTIDQTRKGIKELVSMTPSQIIILLFVILMMGVCAGSGFILVEFRNSVIRREQQYMEDRSDWTRFTQSELEKGRQMHVTERDKDRAEAKEQRKVIEEVKIALNRLTEALNKKSGNIMD